MIAGMIATHRLSRAPDQTFSDRTTAAAYESSALALRPHAFLNQLLHFDTPRLIIRTPGLSLCRETEFGVFFREQDPTVPVFTDPVSGLTVDAREVCGIFLYVPRSGPPTFELQFKSEGFALAIQPGTSEYSRLLVDRITTSFAGTPVTSQSISSQGAGAWLDEWPNLAGHQSSLEINAGQFDARLTGRGFFFQTSGQLHRSEQDESIHRLISLDRHTFIFAHQSVTDLIS